MSFARPKHEDVFVRNYLKRELRALAVDPEMLQKFLDYAHREAGAHPARFKARMYHVVNGRTPTAYIALLVADFFRNRKYESVVRKTINHVEYVTSDGDTSSLEDLVSRHPFQLRIIRVKLHDGRVSVVLRTPIQVPDWDKMAEDAVTEVLNAKLAEFQEWLRKECVPLPTTCLLASSESAEVHYDPDWAEGKYREEWDFDERSNLSGTVDIHDIIDLLLLCAFKDKAPGVNPKFLDLFYELREVLGESWSERKPQSYSVQELWNALTKDASVLPHAFFQQQGHFNPALTKTLQRFFDDVAKKHRTLIKRAQTDLEEMDRQDEAYVAEAETFQVYEDVRQKYADELRVLLGSHKTAIAAALQSIIKVEHKRARGHFSKLRGVFDTSPA